jgi:hypothetical protein
MDYKSIIYVVALILLSATSPTQAGVKVLSPAAASNQTFHAPEWICTGPTVPLVKGM